MMNMTYKLSTYSCNKYGIFRNGTRILFKCFGSFFIYKPYYTDTLIDILNQEANNPHIYTFLDDEDLRHVFFSINTFDTDVKNEKFISESLFNEIHQGNFSFTNKFSQIIKDQTCFNDVQVILLKRLLRKCVKENPDDKLVLNGIWYK